MTTPQPDWRYVPFVSTLLICSGLFVLLHGAPAPPVRAFSSTSACGGASAPAAPHSLARTPIVEDLDSRSSRTDRAQVFVSASTQVPADTDLLDDVIAADAGLWSSLRFRTLWLRGPPSSDDAGAKHRVGTGPVDSSFDATDDDDDGDDDADTDDSDGVAAPVTLSADLSCVVHTSSLLSRVEVHHPVSFTSDVESLRAPPQ